jgi:hypothetical protein
VIFCWLALLASIGLAAASYLSFPVAAFASLALLIMGLSSGTIGSVVEEGTITGYDAAKGGYGHSPVDIVLLPVFRGALKIINLVEGFSPIDYLSSGRSIGGGANRPVIGRLLLRAWHDLFHPKRIGHGTGEHLSLVIAQTPPIRANGNAVSPTDGRRPREIRIGQAPPVRSRPGPRNLSAWLRGAASDKGKTSNGRTVPDNGA